MQGGGGLAVEEGAMMTTMVSTNVPFSGVGKGDGNCNGNSDGNSNSGGDTFNNQQMLQAAIKTGVTMVTSCLGPYHGLWLDDAPTKHIGIIPTPWTMTRALGFAEILQAHEWLVPLLTAVFHDFWECAEYFWRGGRLVERKG